MSKRPKFKSYGYDGSYTIHNMPLIGEPLLAEKYDAGKLVSARCGIVVDRFRSEREYGKKFCMSYVGDRRMFNYFLSLGAPLYVIVNDYRAIGVRLYVHFPENEYITIRNINFMNMEEILVHPFEEVRQFGVGFLSDKIDKNSK